MFDHAAKGGAPRRGGTLQFLRVNENCSEGPDGRPPSAAQRGYLWNFHFGENWGTLGMSHFSGECWRSGG